jgi:hypothetical protein
LDSLEIALRLAVLPGVFIIVQNRSKISLKKGRLGRVHPLCLPRKGVVITGWDGSSHTLP